MHVTLDAYGQALTPCSTDAACQYDGCKDEGGVPYPAACVAGHCQHGDGGGGVGAAARVGGDVGGVDGGHPDTLRHRALGACPWILRSIGTGFE